MSVFIRRFLTDPGNEVFLEIESINVLDLEPPASITGIGTGTVIHVGEFENGPFNEPLEIAGTSDFVRTLGELGYARGGVKGYHPCARSRRADGALRPEHWNGNGFIQLNGKRFRRLVCVRVDTSVGEVEFRRQAYVTGESAFAFNLEPGQTLPLDVGAGPVTATFAATAATVTSGAQTFPSGFVGGEQLVLGYDDAPNVTVTFLAADQSQAQVIARINQYAGFVFAASVSATTMALTGLTRGSAGQVRVVSASAGVLTALGLTAATTLGTGNVRNIDAVSFAEVRSVVTAAIPAVEVEPDPSGRIRISKKWAGDDDYIRVGAATATALGFEPGVIGSADGRARLRGVAGTFPLTGSGTVTLGVDAETDVTIALASADTQAQVISKINAALGGTVASSASATVLLLTARANGGQVRVVSASAASVLTELGLTLGDVSAPSAIVAATVPAGTTVRNAAGDRVVVTMRDVEIAAPEATASGYVVNSGPYPVRVRHAQDDGSGASAPAGSVTVVEDAPASGSFAAVNPQVIAAALTEAAIDAAYVEAIASTLDLNSVAREANVIYAARQSNTVRRALRSNALEASRIGMFGRMAVVRTPLGVSRATALSRVAEPGVGAYRSDRVIFCWPQANSFVPAIARRGLAGGEGFTADGNVDIGADGFMASILSQLPPEENPGQATTFTDGVNGLESSPNAKGLTMADYVALKGGGVAALRMDDGTAIFQSGITSVDPGVNPNLKNIARRRMADFIQDTLARRLKNFGKKLSKDARRRAMTSEIRAWLNTLLSANNPTQQRIDSFSVKDKEGNTQETLAQGIFRIITKVRTLASLDAIVLETTVGESVQIDELPMAA